MLTCIHFNTADYLSQLMHPTLWIFSLLLVIKLLSHTIVAAMIRYKCWTISEYFQDNLSKPIEIVPFSISQSFLIFSIQFMKSKTKSKLYLLKCGHDVSISSSTSVPHQMMQDVLGTLSFTCPRVSPYHYTLAVSCSDQVTVHLIRYPKDVSWGIFSD